MRMHILEVKNEGESGSIEAKGIGKEKGSSSGVGREGTIVNSSGLSGVEGMLRTCGLIFRSRFSDL